MSRALKKRYHAEVTLKAPKVPFTAKPFVARPTRKAATRSNRAVTASSATAKSRWSLHASRWRLRIRKRHLRRLHSEARNCSFPQLRKAFRRQPARGYLAGYPVVDFKVTLYDGSYHDVDSNELSFKTAGRLAFKKAMEQAKPCLLEPVMKVEIEAPDDFCRNTNGRPQLSSRP